MSCSTWCRAVPFPLISIIEATRDAILAAGMRRVALIGTRFTMQGGFYQAVCAAAGIALVTLTGQEQDEIHEQFLGELVPGIFLPETRERVLTILRRMREQQGSEGVILGGTELPVLLRDGTDAGIPSLTRPAFTSNARSRSCWHNPPGLVEDVPAPVASVRLGQRPVLVR